MKALKIFIAEYRYRINGTGPFTKYVEIMSPSLADAKRVARGLEGREDDTTWLMGVVKQQEVTHA